MDGSSLSFLILAAALLLANALFVAAEFALVALRRTQIEELILEGHRGALRVREILERLDECLSTCQVGITLASLGLGWIGERAFAGFFESCLGALGVPAEGLFSFTAHALAALIAFLLITFLHVVLGEQSPKMMALQLPIATALWVAWPMRLCNRIFYPLVWVLNRSTRAVLKLFGLKPLSVHARVHSEEELGMLLDESHRAGLLEPGERKMLERVFRFHDKTVKEIMVPRLDMVALDLRAEPRKAVEKAFEVGYSRLPVCDGTLDKIVGIVYAKDLLYTLSDPKLIKLADLVREHLDVPESYSVSRLLRDFQKRRIHMAIVVDEFGATAGLVTLEDLVEEIVGEIQDEHDQEPAEVEKLPDGSTQFLGQVHLDRFREAFPESEIPEGAFDTIGGLVLHLAGRVPKEGDTFRLGDLALRVTQREGRRIRKVAVRQTPPGASSPRIVSAG